MKTTGDILIIVVVLAIVVALYTLFKFLKEAGYFGLHIEVLFDYGSIQAWSKGELVGSRNINVNKDSDEVIAAIARSLAEDCSKRIRRKRDLKRKLR